MAYQLCYLPVDRIIPLRVTSSIFDKQRLNKIFTINNKYDTLYKPSLRIYFNICVTIIYVKLRPKLSFSANRCQRRTSLGHTVNHSFGIKNETICLICADLTQHERDKRLVGCAFFYQLMKFASGKRFQQVSFTLRCQLL